MRGHNPRYEWLVTATDRLLMAVTNRCADARRGDVRKLGVSSTSQYPLPPQGRKTIVSHRDLAARR